MDVSSVIGNYGPFQRNVYLFCLLRGIPYGFHLVVYSFYLPVVDHWCARPGDYRDNFTVDEWKELAVPPEVGYVGFQTEVRYSSCLVFSRLGHNGSGLVFSRNDTQGCDRWEYGDSFYRHSLVQEWDLVCELAWMRSLVQTTTMAGMIVGTLLCSTLGDRLGRRPLVICSFTVCLIGGLACSAAPSFITFLASRSILGIGLGLGQGSSLCLLMEVIGPRKRTTTAIAFTLGFCLGLVALTGLAWILQEWRQLQVTISVFLIPFVIWAWYLPESPRWLVATGRMKKARDVILRAAKANNIEIPDVDLVLVQLRKKIQHENRISNEGNCSDLVRVSRIRWYSIILVFCSMASGAVFYGLQLSVTSLGGDPYLSFLMAAAAELPAGVIAYCIVRWCRRRTALMVLFGSASVFCVGVTLLASSDLPWLRQAVAITGKMLASSALTIVWIFAAEVFPTVVRTVGVSVCLIGTRVGSGLAPFLIELRSYLPEAVPMMILAMVYVVAAVLLIPLPETFRVPLPDTMWDTMQLKNTRVDQQDAANETPDYKPVPTLPDDALANGANSLSSINSDGHPKTTSH